MARNFYRTKRYYKRPAMPTERNIRGGDFTVIGANIVAYTYTANDPCKFCNATLDIGIMADDVVNKDAVYYALVYVPEGYDVNTLGYGSLSNDMYSPSKNVLIIGTIANPSSQVTKRAKVSRKMAKGDRIALIVTGGQASQPVTGRFTLQFTTVH